MRKKPKRSIRPAPVLWLLLVVNLLAGLLFSRITSIVHVRTVGVKEFDKARIEGILAKLKDVPCMRIDSRVVEGEVMASPDVDRAEFTRNLFGNALLNVQYRTPVAKLADVDGEALSVDGVLYQASEIPLDLPTLQLPDGGPPTLAAFAGNWQPQRLASLSVYARQHYPRIESKIEVNRRGVVCLNIGSGRVILGSCDDLDVKLKTLESRLQRNPQELDQVKELNLTSPSVPAVVPKKSGKHGQSVRIPNQ
jgi:cell division septal protein FtsQ